MTTPSSSASHPVASTAAPRLTLYNLDDSRAFRVAWVLEELGLKYENKTFARIDGKRAPQEMTASTNVKLNKSPTLVDYGPADAPFEEPLTLWESGAILHYLIERYGQHTTLLPLPSDPASTSSWAHRQSILSWIHFSESIMLHTLPTIYNRWFARQDVPGDQDALAHLEPSLAINVGKDLDAVEKQLFETASKYAHDQTEQKQLFLVADVFTAADIMVAFSCEYVFSISAAATGQSWPTIEAWLRQMAARPAYQRTKQNGTAHRFTFVR